MIKIDGTNSKILFLAGTGNQTTLQGAPTATPWVLTLPTGPGTAGQVLTTDGTGNLSWSAGGGGAAVTVADTTANATFYPMFSSITSGTLAVTNVSSTNYTYNPSSGYLTAPIVEASAGFFVNASTITGVYNIPAGNNALSAGPMVVPPGSAVNVAPGQAWKVV